MLIIHWIQMQLFGKNGKFQSAICVHRLQSILNIPTPLSFPHTHNPFHL